MPKSVINYSGEPCAVCWQRQRQRSAGSSVKWLCHSIQPGADFILRLLSRQRMVHPTELGCRFYGWGAECCGGRVARPDSRVMRGEVSPSRPHHDQATQGEPIVWWNLVYLLTYQKKGNDISIRPLNILDQLKAISPRLKMWPQMTYMTTIITPPQYNKFDLEKKYKWGQKNEFQI